MTDTLFDTGELLGARGLVGDRQLILVQTFDIARLTSHPVPIIPGTFIAVGGRGPKDSNESGKTSFLAATSLLLGDSGWKLTGAGGAAATALLFEPETAGVSSQAYAPARHGYVLGVFAQPEDPAATALTVWLRISSSTPHILVRWRESVALPSSRGQIDVDAAWDALGTRNQAGSNTYVERLYGDTPRCLAWVAQRGSLISEKSLLQMNAGAFKPHEIADDLISLTGRRSLFENEKEARETLFRQQEELRQRREAYEKELAVQAAQLDSVKRRDEARRRLERAKEFWRLHYAAGLIAVVATESEFKAELKAKQEAVDEIDGKIADIIGQLCELEDVAELNAVLAAALADHGRLSTQLKQAEQGVTTAQVLADQHRPRVPELEAASSMWTGVSVEDATVALEEATAEVARRRGLLGAASARLEEAEQKLRQVGDGGAGLLADVLRRLADTGLAAAGLIDSVEVDEEWRSQWESKLVLYAAAATVSPTGENSLAAALAAVADVPGAVLVSGAPGIDLPAGIRSAPEAARQLLAALADRGLSMESPTRVVDAGAGVHVIGGFPFPVVGHEAQVAAAERAVQAARDDEARARDELRLATLSRSTKEAELRAATAAADLVTVRAELARQEDALQKASDEVARLTPLHAEADDRRVKAQGRVDGREEAIKSRHHVRNGLETERRNRDGESKNLGKRLRELHVDYWRSGWGGTEEEAEQALEAGPRKEETLRNRASLALNDALSALGIASDVEIAEIADTPELAEVVRRRKVFYDAVDDAQRAVFPEVLQPLQDWLDMHHDRDAVLADRIARDSAVREEEIGLAERICGSLAEQLKALQDGIEDRLRQALEQVSREYDRLDREKGNPGADLLIESHPPKGPKDTWTWEVTPRWRRSRSGQLLSYKHQTNSAQAKQQTVHLVLAALLSSPSAHGRLLLLDEVGDSFGVQHRREVLEAVAQTAVSRGVTVLATCQDSLISDAMRYCSEVLYFEYASRQEALNRPTRAYGFDENRKRVEITAEEVLAGRR